MGICPPNDGQAALALLSLVQSDGGFRQIHGDRFSVSLLSTAVAAFEVLFGCAFDR